MLWINVVKEKATIKKQWFRNNLSLLCKKCKILVKNERNTKEVSWSDLLKNQKHVNDATLFNHVILQTQKQRHCTACSEFESLNSFEKVTEMSKEIANSAHIMHWSFVILTYDVHVTLNINNQKTFIKKLIRDNTKLHEDLEMLRITWFKKIIKSEKIHSSLIVKIAIKTMIN